MILLKINFYLHKGIFTIYIMYIVHVQVFCLPFLCFFFFFFGTLVVNFFSPPLHIHVVLFEIDRDAVCKWYLSCENATMTFFPTYLRISTYVFEHVEEYCFVPLFFFMLFCFVNIIRWYSHMSKTKTKKKKKTFCYLVTWCLFCEALLMSWHVHLRVLMHCI